MDHHDPTPETQQDPFSWTQNPAPPNPFSANRQQESPGGPTPPQQTKTGGGVAKIVALCLICALVGGIGGGGLAVLTSPSGGTSSTLQMGDRNPVELETVSVNTQAQMTVPEVYANYIDSCVGITVDIVTTNIFGQTITGAAAGSGFVITEDGYIVTNYHVIDGANTITVTFSDGSSYPATVVGGEAGNDVAVIKINATDLHPVVIGDSDDMYVGETVVTIGNPLGELTFSLSDGVISALDRTITMSDNSKMNMLQTNCTINSGNSGGPLFNLYGEVIGIVSAKYSSSTGDLFSGAASVEGLGFAIPINDVTDMVNDIIQNGYVTGKPYLGISVMTVSDEAQLAALPAGAEIIYAAPGLCAQRDGLREGDIVTAVGKTEITTNEELIAAKNTYKAGDVVNFTIYRDGKTLVVPVTLDEENADTAKILNDYVTERQQEEARQAPQNPPQQNQPQQDQPRGNQGFGGFYWPF